MMMMNEESVALLFEEEDQKGLHFILSKQGKEFELGLCQG